MIVYFTTEACYWDYDSLGSLYNALLLAHVKYNSHRNWLKQEKTDQCHWLYEAETQNASTNTACI